MRIDIHTHFQCLDFVKHLQGRSSLPKSVLDGGTYIIQCAPGLNLPALPKIIDMDQNITVFEVPTGAEPEGVLVSEDGKTVYMFDKDNGATSACTDGCASVWPAVTSSGTPAAGAGVDASKLSTASGQAPDQVTYGGHLLYEYSGDSAPGQTNGTKVPGWHDVSAAGTAAS